MKTLRALAVLALAACDGNIDDGGPLLAVTQRASVGDGGAEGDNNAFFASISADGRYVAFQSDASNLVPGDTNGASDVFVRDTLLGTTVRVSVADDESEADGGSRLPSISADGRRVAFVSDARSLVTPNGDTNASPDIYLRDLDAGTTVLVSATTTTAPAGGCDGRPAVSPDGGFVAFTTAVTPQNLDAATVAGNNGFSNVFLRRLATSETFHMSAGTSSGTGIDALGNGLSINPALSQLGSNGVAGLFVVFESQATNLVNASGAGTTPQIWRVAFPRTALADAVPVSVSPGGGLAGGNSTQPSVSRDGDAIAFISAADDILPPGQDSNGQDDVFLRRMSLPVAGSTVLVSRNDNGLQASAGSTLPSVSADGRFVAYRSTAPNLVGDDTNLAADVFLTDAVAAVTTRVSVRTYGEQTPPFVNSDNPVLSADGRFVAFDSGAGTLVDGDSNGFSDVFVRGPLN